MKDKFEQYGYKGAIIAYIVVLNVALIANIYFPDKKEIVDALNLFSIAFPLGIALRYCIDKLRI